MQRNVQIERKNLKKGNSVLIMSLEKEESLIVCSSEKTITNLELTNKIKSWQDVNSNYNLIDLGEILFHDLYFDTQQRIFQNKKISFRIREVNNNKFLTIKIPSLQQLQQESSSLRSDEEIEVEWSKDKLLEIFHILEKRRIYTLQSDENIYFNNLNVIYTMRKLGFSVIQNRHTQRRIKNIIKSEKKNELLAEMAIEQVIFQIGNDDVYHYDIEIEDKSSDGSHARIFLINKLLSSDYGKMLIKWKYGKISIGKGLEILIRSKELENKFNLAQDVYKRIEYLIQNNLL
jgi:adenylate cyclase class IV